MRRDIGVFSFFSGAGFLDLGFEVEGIENQFVNEIHLPFMQTYQYSRSNMGLPQPVFGYSTNDINFFTQPDGIKFLKKGYNL